MHVNTQQPSVCNAQCNWVCAKSTRTYIANVSNAARQALQRNLRVTVGEIMNKHTNKSTKNTLTSTHPHLRSHPCGS
jgi:hypothetical protein